MAGNCEMQEKVSELTCLLQKEKELRVREQQRATEREKALRSEMETMIQTITNQNAIKVKALERERNMLKEISLKNKNSAVSDLTDGCKAEKAEIESVMKQRDDLQKELEQVKLQLNKEKDQRVERQLRDSEREKLLRKEVSDLREQLQRERDQCTASFVPKLKALERQNKALVAHIQQLEMSCEDDNLTLKDLSQTDRAESKDKVTEFHQETSAPPENEAKEEPKNSEGGSVLNQETLANLAKEFQTKVSDTLEALDRRVKVLNNDLNRLKMSFECVAQKYRAQKTENEALQNLVEDLNIKLQTEKATDKETAWETEREAYLKQIEDLNLICHGKSLRVEELLSKLKEQKAHTEAIKEENFKRNQALNIKNRQLLDSSAQQKLEASERERVLSLKVQELEQKISDYEKEAHLKLTATSPLEDEKPQPESSGEKKKKKRKGWKKFVHYAKPWNWGRKS